MPTDDIDPIQDAKAARERSLARDSARPETTVQGLVGLVTTDGRTPDEADITLATGAAPQPGDPWLTTRREDWPEGLWPPRPGDRITVTTPRVIAASRPS